MPSARYSIPKELPKALGGQPVTGVRRRAKYLLIDTPKVTLLSHLGMTGSWRVLEKGLPKNQGDKHDHCLIHLADGRTLAFRDPRRFGILDLVRPGEETKHPRLRGLGVEPLDEKAFTAEYLCGIAERRKVAIKVLLMDQKVVVGIGNIYASEALFRAGVRPARLSSRLKRGECERIVGAAREVLEMAIQAGGSSIRDYRNLSGEPGGFQDLHLVYGRAGEPCRNCGALIQAKVIGGRSTYWCPRCQK